jgi:hypothetical protein
MPTHRVAVLPGDGIGAEVTAEAVRVLGVVAKEGGLGLELEEGLIGGAAIDGFGNGDPNRIDGNSAANDLEGRGGATRTVVRGALGRRAEGRRTAPARRQRLLRRHGGAGDQQSGDGKDHEDVSFGHNFFP